MRKTVSVGTLFVFGLGAVVGALVMSVKDATPAKAGTAMGNDKFSIVTVPVNINPIGDTEAVFVLDHLSGVLRGSVLNDQSAGFSHHYIRNLGPDFNLDPRTPNPKYAIASGFSSIQGRPQPANGVIYVAELTSGVVIAYGFARPQGRGAPGPLEIAKLSYFQFRESIGG